MAFDIGRFGTYLYKIDQWKWKGGCLLGEIWPSPSEKMVNAGHRASRQVNPSTPGLKA